MTTTDEELVTILTDEVSSMSIKLVNAVQKQLDLEQRVNSLNKELAFLKLENSRLTEVESNHIELLPKYASQSDELVESKKEQLSLKDERDKLSREVEELTASLFDEANKMVSKASRETHSVQVKNGFLIEELQEKNLIISNLQLQLSDLKSMINEIEDKALVSSSSYIDPFSQSIYSPTIKSIRLDLSNYNTEFKTFIFALIKPDFLFEISTLKTFKFFKKIWSDEIESSLSIIPSVSQNSFLKNFQRGKNFWSSIIEGRAIIEPVKGKNESFKLNYKGPRGDFPTAIEDPCATCGESRNDNLEHSRLYYFKLLNEVDSNEVLASFPLCNWCLIIIRNIADFFAKLRLINKNNVYKLKQNSAFDETPSTGYNLPNQFKRSSSSNIIETTSSTPTLLKDIKLDPNEEGKLFKIYISLILVRNKLFWSKLGIWDNDNEIKEVNIDEIKLDSFVKEGSESVASVITTEISPKLEHYEIDNGPIPSIEKVASPQKQSEKIVSPKIDQNEISRRRSQVEAASLRLKQLDDLREAERESERKNEEAEREAERKDEESKRKELVVDPELEAKQEQQKLVKAEVEKKENELKKKKEAESKIKAQIEEERLENEKRVKEQETLKQEQIAKEEIKQEKLKQEKIYKLEEEKKAKQQQLDEVAKIASKEETKKGLSKKEEEKQKKAAKKEMLAAKREALKAQILAEKEEETKTEESKGRVSDLVKKAEQEEEIGLVRKNSKTKQFSKKINQGLDDTLELLKESIE